MKTLLLMRHAKSSWKDLSLADHDRPLNRRGRNAAELMGEFLNNQDLVPEAILCSTAKRAKQTVNFLLHTLSFGGEVYFTRDLYHSGSDAYLQELHKLDSGVSVVMLVAHNPGMESAIEDFCGEWERMPTAAIARIDFEIIDWSEVDYDLGDLKVVWRPKEI